MSARSADIVDLFLLAQRFLPAVVTIIPREWSHQQYRYSPGELKLLLNLLIMLGYKSGDYRPQQALKYHHRLDDII